MTAIVTCSRCRVQVPVSALALAQRCVDPHCPLQAHTKRAEAT